MLIVLWNNKKTQGYNQFQSKHISFILIYCEVYLLKMQHSEVTQSNQFKMLFLLQESVYKILSNVGSPLKVK